MNNKEMIEYFANNVDAFKVALEKDEKLSSFNLIHKKVNNIHLFSHIIEKVFEDDLPNKEDFILMSTNNCLSSILDYSLFENTYYTFSDKVWDFMLSNEKIMNYKRSGGIGLSSSKIVKELLKKQNPCYENLSDSNLIELPTPVLIALTSGRFIDKKEILMMSDGINTVAHYYAMLGFEIKDIKVLKTLNYYEVPVINYMARSGVKIPEDLYDYPTGGQEMFYEQRKENGWSIKNFENNKPIISSFLNGSNYDINVLEKYTDDSELKDIIFFKYLQKENASLKELKILNSKGSSVAFEKALKGEIFKDKEIYLIGSGTKNSVAHAMVSSGYIINEEVFFDIKNERDETALECFLNQNKTKSEKISMIDLDIVPKNIFNKKLPIGYSIGYILGFENNLDELSDVIDDEILEIIY